MLEGFHIGIKNAVVNSVRNSSYKNETDSSAKDKKENSGYAQSMSLMLADRKEKESSDKHGIKIDDSTLTLIGDVICQILDSCDAEYSRATIMNIMSDVKQSEVMDNFFYALLTELADKQSDRDGGFFTTDDVIYIVEEYKDGIESFFRNEFKKYNTEITEELLSKIEKAYADKMKQRIELKIDDEYLFVHLIEAILRAFRSSIDKALSDYLNSVQRILENGIKDLLDEGGIEYDPNDINGIVYDLLNSKEMTDIMYDGMSKFIQLVLSGKDDIDFVSEIEKLVDKHSKTIEKFIKEELEKYDLPFTEEVADKFEQLYEDRTGKKINIDPKSDTVFTDLIKSTLSANKDEINSQLSGSREVFDKLTEYVPEFLLKVFAYVLPDENMTTVRIGYVSTSVVSSVLVTLLVTPKFGVLKSIGTSGVISGIIMSVVGAVGLIAKLLLTNPDLSIVQSLVGGVGSSELTMGLITTGVGVVSLIAFSIAGHATAGAATAGAAASTAGAGAATAQAPVQSNVEPTQAPEPTESTEPTENTEDSQSSQEESENK